MPNLVLSATAAGACASPPLRPARAMGNKASDEWSVPLCFTHHRTLHTVGNEEAWWSEKGIDAKPQCAAQHRTPHRSRPRDRQPQRPETRPYRRTHHSLRRATGAFERFYAELVFVLKPQGPIGYQLAERIAINAWRHRRAYRVESGPFERARSAWRKSGTEQTSEIDLVFLRLSTSGGDELSKLSR